MGETVAALKARGLYDSTYIVISADHGQTTATQHQSLAPVLEAAGLKVRDSVARDPLLPNMNSISRRWQEDVHIEVNGNAAVFFYLHEEATASPSLRVPFTRARKFQARNGRIVDIPVALLGSPAVELVMGRDGLRKYRILGRRGEASLERAGQLYRYKILYGEDPLQFPKQVREHAGFTKFQDKNWWFRFSAAGPYPDAFHQIAGLLDSPKSPDLVISATPGWEPWNEGQVGLHGALRREHMRVPLLVAGPGVPVKTLSRARTADVFPTLCQILGVDYAAPEGTAVLPWKSRTQEKQARFTKLHR